MAGTKTPVVRENSIYEYLENFDLRIDILQGESSFYFQLETVDKENGRITICFKTLEDVYFFIKDVVANSKSAKDVAVGYRNMIEQGELNIDNPIKVTNNEAEVSLLAINQMIAYYFGHGKKYKVGAKSVLDTDSKPAVIKFYLLEHLDYAGTKRLNETLLFKGDLNNVFNHYLGQQGYELVDYEYSGKSPNYTGLKLRVKEKELGLKF